jgi:hypothetical protein
MADKIYTAKEAAIAVLAKAEELYKSSSLAKAETKHDRCVKDVEANSPDVKNAHAVCVAEGVKPEKWSKSELNKAEVAAAAPAAPVEQHSAEAGMKGHIKLAKFMGRMEHKKEQKAKAMQKGDGQTLGAAIGFPGAAPTAPAAAPSPSPAMPVVKGY